MLVKKIAVPEGCAMLVFARKLNERIVITLDDGRTIAIDVLEIEKEKIRLGFTAPPEVIVDRQEVYERRQQTTRRPLKG